MEQSLSYYLTMLVIKLKGLKKNFSQDPIDVVKVRKGDVYFPKGAFFKSHVLRDFRIMNTSIKVVGKSSASGDLLIFIHGGAFISGPAQHHWDTVKEIVSRTHQTVWLVNYPKAPEHKITEISNNIDAVYQEALQRYTATQISLFGDSVGGTLAMALLQRLVQNRYERPRRLLLVSPVMDASMSNPDIELLAPRDPILAPEGVLSAKKKCAENLNLKDVRLSPLNGDFLGFPETTMYVAENDITYPDQKLAIEKMRAAEVRLEVVEGKNMPHIWPLLPVMYEARLALKNIIDRLNN